MRETLAKHRWLQLLVLAAAYAAAGKLGLSLAIPPGYATAVWPASGIALAGLLLGGPRLWPAVWLGSFCVNLLHPTDFSDPRALLRSAGIAAVLGLGASLQAVAGAKLVRRVTGERNPLEDQRDVLGLLFWGGPVACLVSATCGIATLGLAGLISSRGVLYHWATWWVGDTIGALIFVPLILVWAEARPGWRRRRLSVALPLAATFVLSVLLFFYSSRREQAALHTAFQDRARTLASAVQASCDGHMEVLISLESLFTSVPGVSHDQFAGFVASSLHRHPGIRALSWNPRVMAADRARFEADAGAPITQRDAAGQRIVAPPKPEYVVVRYVEPATDQKAVGLDVASETVRREALVRARDSGATAATGPIRLVNDDGELLSILLFAPVYDTRPVPADLEQRRRSIRGYATAAFRLADLVETAIRHLPRDGLTVALFDRSQLDGSGLLYADALWRLRGSEAGAPVWRGPFVFGGRSWEVHVAATQAYLDTYRSWRAWLILIGGFLFTGLLGAFLLVVTSRTARVEELIIRRTAELQSELQERHRAEGVVRLGEARNRAILEHMIGGMITFDEESRIESVNPAAEKIFGYPEEELIGRSIVLLLADAPAGDQESYLRRAHKAALGRVTELGARRKDGTVFPAEAALFEFEAPEGRRFACNFQDISERREVDRLKSEFVSTVSHELRTPLTSIRGSLGLLAAGVLGEFPPQARDIIGVAQRNAVRLTALINDILDFERLESGKVEMEIENVDLQPLFEKSLESVRPVADEQKIAVVCLPTALRLRADADRIVQVLVNLLSNAVKFSSAGSEVRVWAEVSKDGQVRILVKDDGAGIPAEDHLRIFERFVQVEASDERGKRGTGLGLAICKAIVEHHGGRIGVDSAPEEGSTFWFEVPRASAI